MRLRGYFPMLLRDCTTAVETGATIPEFAITNTVIADLERWFPTTESAEFLAACGPAG